MTQHHVLNKNLSIIGSGDGAAWVGVMLYERYKCPKVDILLHGEKASFSPEVSELIKNITLIFTSKIIYPHHLRRKY